MEKEGIFLQFRLWEQGRIDMEDMVERFEAIVKHALWEVVTEYYLMPNDFMASTSSMTVSKKISKKVQIMKFSLHSGPENLKKSKPKNSSNEIKINFTDFFFVYFQFSESIV